MPVNVHNIEYFTPLDGPESMMQIGVSAIIENGSPLRLNMLGGKPSNVRLLVAYPEWFVPTQKVIDREGFTARDIGVLARSNYHKYWDSVDELAEREATQIWRNMSVAKLDRLGVQTGWKLWLLEANPNIWVYEEKLPSGANIARTQRTIIPPDGEWLDANTGKLELDPAEGWVFNLPMSPLVGSGVECLYGDTEDGEGREACATGIQYGDLDILNDRYYDQKGLEARYAQEIGSEIATCYPQSLAELQSGRKIMLEGMQGPTLEAVKNGRLVPLASPWSECKWVLMPSYYALGDFVQIVGLAIIEEPELGSPNLIGFAPFMPLSIRYQEHYGVKTMYAAGDLQNHAASQTLEGDFMELYDSCTEGRLSSNDDCGSVYTEMGEFFEKWFADYKALIWCTRACANTLFDSIPDSVIIHSSIESN